MLGAELNDTEGLVFGLLNQNSKLDHVDINVFKVAEFIRDHVRFSRGLSRIELVKNVTDLLGSSGSERPNREARVNEVLRNLLFLGDVGSGDVFGQEFIVPLSPKEILLPNGTVALLGDYELERGHCGDLGGIIRIETHDDQDAVYSLQDELGSPAFSNISLEAGDSVSYAELARMNSTEQTMSKDVAAWVSFSNGRPIIACKGHLSKSDEIPDQLKRAFLLCGVFSPEKGTWSVDELVSEFLTNWVGATPPTDVNDGSEHVYDSDQKAVISAPVAARMVVEAGPGTGKTTVVCSRVARLIQNGAAPSRIWLLSFTKVAVEEISKRIGIELGNYESAASIKLATFDSFAGRLNSAFNQSPSSPDQGYEKNISRAIGLLEANDLTLRDFLNEIEHVVIDEAQDLVGRRRVFVELLIDALPESCGVTILGDFAQAIYGFQADSKTDEQGWLSRRPSRKPEGKFIGLRMSTDYRTQNDNLKQLFGQGREVLRSEDLSGEQKYDQIRSLIQKYSTGVLRGNLAANSGGLNDALVLFRGRASLYKVGTALASRGSVFRYKIAGHAPVLAPWVGAVLAGAPLNQSLNRESFHVLWESLEPYPKSVSEQDAWGVLLRLSKSQGKTFLVFDVWTALNRGVPASLLENYVGGRRGPFLSTIHGAKGREADKVVLMLPSRRIFNEDQGFDWEEEARVLYVGATRARKDLILGKPFGGRLWPSRGDRKWIGFRGGCKIEIGRLGDLETDFCAGENIIEQEALEMTRRLWKRGSGITSVEARRDEQTGRYLLFALDGSEGRSGTSGCLGGLSSSLIEDIASIAKTDVKSLPGKLSGFSMMGCSTVTSSNGGRTSSAPGIGLIPVITGFVTIESNWI